MVLSRQEIASTLIKEENLTGKFLKKQPKDGSSDSGQKEKKLTMTALPEEN